jgi:sorting nexin-1/2
MPKGADYILYRVNGTDREGKFEIWRRYSDFEVLRQTLVERFPGLYVPPIPKKKAIGNKNAAFLDERCFLLNMFLKQLARCPYLIESEEFGIWIKP